MSECHKCELGLRQCNCYGQLDKEIGRLQKENEQIDIVAGRRIENLKAEIDKLQRAVEWLNSNIVFCNYIRDGKARVLSMDEDRAPTGQCWREIPAEFADIIKPRDARGEQKS